MNNGQRVRALREWAHRDESAAERQSRLERLVRAEVELERDLDAPIRWRPIAEAPKEWTKVLIADRVYGVTMGYFNDRGNRWETHTGLYCDPTHFAELKGPDHG